MSFVYDLMVFVRRPEEGNQRKDPAGFVSGLRRADTCDHNHIYSLMVWFLSYPVMPVSDSTSS
jgi:hypothetical protein